MRHTASAKKKSSGNGTSTKSKRASGSDSSRFAVCINNSGYPASLELHKIYRVLRDDRATKDGDLRIVDDSGEDYLYSSERFVLVELPEKLKASLTKAR